jgi:hypothetical protein
LCRAERGRGFVEDAVELAKASLMQLLLAGAFGFVLLLLSLFFLPPCLRLPLLLGVILPALLLVPFSPLLTWRPSWFHAYIPATLVAKGRCLAISRMLPRE